MLIKRKFHTTVSEILLPFCVSQRYIALTRCKLGKCECFVVTTHTVMHEVCKINDYFGGKNVMKDLLNELLEIIFL